MHIYLSQECYKQYFCLSAYHPPTTSGLDIICLAQTAENICMEEDTSVLETIDAQAAHPLLAAYSSLQRPDVHSKGPQQPCWRHHSVISPTPYSFSSCSQRPCIPDASVIFPGHLQVYLLRFACQGPSLS